MNTRIRKILESTGYPFEIVPCDPKLAETAVFAEHYGYSMEDSANCILVKTKTGEKKFVACLVLATTRLDVNKRVRKKIGARKVSFAGAEETRDITGMDLGGVTPFGLPDDLPLWVDARVMERETIILGGGDRSSKIVLPPRALEILPGLEVVEGLALEIS